MTNPKIIIIGADQKWEEDALLKADYPNIEIVLLKDIDLCVSNQTKLIHNGENLFERLTGNERFIIRRSRGQFEKLLAIVGLLKKRGFIFTDSFSAVATNLNKEIAMATLESTIFPHPTGSFFAQPGKILTQELTFPLISKPVTGRHGEGIHIHDNIESLQAEVHHTQEPLLIQPYLNIHTEYRIFVIGNDALGAVKKEAAPGEKVANYAAGAQFEAVTLPSNQLNEAVKLCCEQGIDIGGVDIAQTDDGKTYILEINRCPEFKAFSAATGIDVAQKIIEFTLQKKARPTET